MLVERNASSPCINMPTHNQLFNNFYNATERWTTPGRMTHLDPTFLNIGDIVLVEVHFFRIVRTDSITQVEECLVRAVMLTLSQIAAAPRVRNFPEAEDVSWSF